MSQDDLAEKIYNMKLGETVYQSDGPVTFWVIRVPGGWVYHCNRLDSNAMTSVFVPFNNEFMPGVTKNDN